MKQLGSLLIAGLALVSALATGVFAIELRDADRVSVHPTQPTEITLTGQALRRGDQAAQLWTSFPAKVEVVDAQSKDANRVRYRITPSGAIAGVVAMRVFDRESVSQALLFTVETHKTTALPATDDDPVLVPCVIECRTPGLSEHRIAIKCEKGKPFSVEVIAARVGGDVDAVIELRDENGGELAFADDHPVVGADPLLHFTPNYTGIHYLSVHDVEYRGGPRMLIRITQSAAASVCFPAAIQNGESNTIELKRLFGKAEAATTMASAISGEGFGYLPHRSALAPIVRTQLPVHVEGSDNLPSLPVMFCGRLNKANEVDVVGFKATAGETMIIEPRSFGAPTIPQLEVKKGEVVIGRRNWLTDPTGPFRITIADAGQYELHIRDAISRGGEGFGYCLSIRNDLAGVLKVNPPKKKTRLNEKPHRQVWQGGEPIAMQVRVDRFGLNHEVSIQATLDAEPCKVEGAIPENKNEAEIRIHQPGEFNELQLRRLVLHGSCEVNGKKLRFPLDLRDHTRKDYQTMEMIPAIIGSSMAVVVVPKRSDQ